MHIAYLINQYPKISHSFIRREIQALERHGVTVMRISIRGWNEQLVDADDEQERTRTRYLLRDGVFSLISATLQLCLTSPIKFSKALALEIKMARRSERPLPVHMVYLAEACKILLWLKRENVEHLHAHFGTNSAEVAMLVHVLGGPPWSFTVHGPEEFDRPRAIGLAEKIRRATFVVAISSYCRSQLFRLVKHTYWTKIYVVHCGLDQKFLDETPGRPPSPRRIVCVGRICEQKGQLLLLEATRILSAKGTDFELVLAGDGEMRGEAQAFIEQHNLSAKVRITGWISNDQVREELLTSRALVLPSFAEGLPVVIMEAMALRRPIISTFVAGIPELVVSGEHGWLVPAGDIFALVNAIAECLEASVPSLERMGAGGRLCVTARHNIEDEITKFSLLVHRRRYGRHLIESAVDDDEAMV
jgi:colanic acid/amylovoran biosynthesis glycosyltransferase